MTGNTDPMVVTHNPLERYSLVTVYAVNTMAVLMPAVRVEEAGLDAAVATPTAQFVQLCGSITNAGVVELVDVDWLMHSPVSIRVITRIEYMALAKRGALIQISTRTFVRYCTSGEIKKVERQYLGRLAL